MNGRSGDAERSASAYRVAHLLQRGAMRGGDVDDDTVSLRRLKAEIGSFLEVAPQTPPVYMEARTSDDHEGGDGSGRPHQAASSLEVELNVVAGVFEEKPPLVGSDGAGGVLLPTASAAKELHARRVEEAQALLDLASALTPSTASHHPTCARPMVEEIPPLVRGESEAESDGASSGVVVVDADDLLNEETSDDEMPVQRRRVVEEMN